MIKLKADTLRWYEAIRKISAKGYRRTKCGNYETFISDHCKTISLGTYSTEAEAIETIYNYRMRRLIHGIERRGLDVDDSVVFMNRYLAFPNGMIFNLHGEEMIGCIGRDGYIHGIFNGQNYDFHRIIASCFVANPYCKPEVNHINGIKTDNRAINLEWCTRSENIRHAYDIGLEQVISGESHHNSKLTEGDIRYIRSSTKTSYSLAEELGVDSSTIRDIRNRRTWRHVK